MRTATGWGLAAIAFTAVMVAHDAGWKQSRRRKRDKDESKWTQEEMAEGERLERKSLKLPPFSQQEEEEEEKEKEEEAISK